MFEFEDYDPAVEFTLLNFSKTTTDIQNALLRVQANLVRYSNTVQSQSLNASAEKLSEDLQTVYYSYLMNIVNNLSDCYNTSD